MTFEPNNVIPFSTDPLLARVHAAHVLNVALLNAVAKRLCAAYPEWDALSRVDVDAFGRSVIAFTIQAEVECGSDPETAYDLVMGQGAFRALADYTASQQQ